MGVSKGNLADSNVSEWSETVSRIKYEYPEVETVIPGHGEYGDAGLLDYTIELFDNPQGILFFLHNRFLETHDLDESHRKVVAILEAERTRRTRQVGMADFVNRLREGR